MSNIGIEIKLNGSVIKRAGIYEDLYSVSCIISSSKRDKELDGDLVLNLGGYNKEKNEYITWINKNLESTDELIVRFINKNFDEPNEVRNGK